MSATAANFSPSGTVNRPVIAGEAAAKTGFNDLFVQMQPSGGGTHLPSFGLVSDDDTDGATTDLSPTGTTEVSPANSPAEQYDETAANCPSERHDETAANSQVEQHDQAAPLLTPAAEPADAVEAVDEPESLYATVRPWTSPSEVPSIINLGAPLGKLAEATISISCFQV